MITPPSEPLPQSPIQASGSQPNPSPFSVELPKVPQTGSVETETIVVPAAGSVPEPPQPEGISVPPSNIGIPPVKGGNPWPKRILIVTLLIALLAGAVILGRYALSVLTAPKEVTLIYWGLWENDGIIRPIIADFEAQNPKIKVQYSKQSVRQYRQRLQTAIESESGPDIFRFHNTWVPMLKNQLSPVPETVMSSSEFASTYYKVASRDLTAGSVIYGIPLMIEGLGLFYNEDLFAKAGITTPPVTWIDLLDMVPKIAKSEGNGFAVSAIALGTTSNIENFSDILALMFMQNGANLADPMKTKDQSIEALGFYRKFSTSTEPVYTWNDTMDNSMYAFAIGKVAMILAPSWRAFDIIEMAKISGNPNLKFKIAPVPQLPGNTVTWASYWVEGVSEKSKYKKEAYEFLKYLTSKEVMQKLYTEESKVRLFGEPYARVDMANLLTADPYAGPYIAQAKDAYSFPLASRTFDDGINDQMMKYMENAVNAMIAGSSAQQELEGTIAKGFAQVLSKYGLISAAPTTP